MFPKNKNFLPIDRVAISLMLSLSILIILLIWGGDRSLSVVKEFTWQKKIIGATDTGFMLTFSRPMDRASVEENVQIQPPLFGKFSWAGRRMVYTLTKPVEYERHYTVKLENAKPSTLGTKKNGNFIKPFLGEFYTPERDFVYIGVEGEEKGRLILYHLTRQEKTILTPKNLVIKDFKPYTTGDRVLFSATEWDNDRPGLFAWNLYTVTTGRIALGDNQTKSPQERGIIKMVLESKEYENLKFDLSPDGNAIALQRINRNNLEDIGLWILRENNQPQHLTEKPAGDFIFSPNSENIFNPQSEGIDILSLKPHIKPLDFLPSFRRVLAFSQDGQNAAMLQSNKDLTNSLFFLNNKGIKKEITRSRGEFLTCQFSPLFPDFYCLISRRNLGENYAETLQLEAIDINTLKSQKVLYLSYHWETQMSLSSDGLMLLIDQIIPKMTDTQKGDLRTENGSAIASSSLLLFSFKHQTSSPAHPEILTRQNLPLKGYHPSWLP